jgi:cell division protein ZapE
VPQFGGSEASPGVTPGTEDGSVGGHRRQYSFNANAQRRFISLVDECYDQGIKLYLSADVPLAELYTGGRLAFEFQRTLSRLIEMQSVAYRNRGLRNQEQTTMACHEN